MSNRCTDSSFLSGPTVDNVAHEVILYIWYKVQRTRYLFVPGTTHLLINVVQSNAATVLLYYTSE